MFFGVPESGYFRRNCSQKLIEANLIYWFIEDVARVLAVMEVFGAAEALGAAAA